MVDLLYGFPQIKILSCNDFGFLKEHTAPMARRWEWGN